jgi:hypothetical protein
LRARAADTEDRGQADLGVLVVRDVNPAIRAIVFPQTKSANKRVSLGAACGADPVQITRTTPLRLMILQLRQMRLTDAITFMIFPFSNHFARNDPRRTNRTASIQPSPCRRKIRM